MDAGLRAGCDRLPLFLEGSAAMTTQLLQLAVLMMAAAIAAAGPQQNEQVEQGQIPSKGGGTLPYKIARLAPAAFTQLPGAVRAELEKRGCLVPQTFRASQPENAISGAFREAGTADWAVLCSREGYSSILVFWKASAESVAELGRRKDTEDLLASESQGTARYARFISAASPDWIRRKKHNKKVGPLEHDGIEDGLLGQGSLIHYFRGNGWVELEGRH